MGLPLSTVGIPSRELRPLIGETLATLAEGGQGSLYIEPRPEKTGIILKLVSDRILKRM